MEASFKSISVGKITTHLVAFFIETIKEIFSNI